MSLQCPILHKIMWYISQRLCYLNMNIILIDKYGQGVCENHSEKCLVRIYSQKMRVIFNYSPNWSLIEVTSTSSSNYQIAENDNPHVIFCLIFSVGSQLILLIQQLRYYQFLSANIIMYF